MYNIYRGLTLALEGTPWRARFADADLATLCPVGTVAVTSTLGGTHAVCTVGAGEGVVLYDPLLGRPVPWSPDRMSDLVPPAVLIVPR